LCGNTVVTFKPYVRGRDSIITIVPESFMKHIFSIVLTVVACSTFSVAQQKNVILYIGDGFGVAPRTAARLALGQGRDGMRFSTDAKFQALALDKLKYNAMITTHSLNSWITDSAPGAAVYACGKVGKVDNEMISIDPTTMAPLQTILEAAKKNGYAVGLVTTTRITHATPAVFATHIWNRDIENTIASQYISSTEAQYEETITAGGTAFNPAVDWELPAPKVGVEVDVLLGGGARHFLPKNIGPNAIVRDASGAVVKNAAGDTVKLGKSSRANNADLIELAKGRGFSYVNSRDALLNIDLSQFTPTSNAKLIGLFNGSHVNYEQDRQQFTPWEPTLAEMTRIAIEVLKRKSPKGFFLMVESGRIDHLEHGNAGGVDVADNKKNYKVVSDIAAAPFDGQYSADTTKPIPVNPGIYGSDYMIKEVLAFDYAVEEGRKVLNDASAGQTLVMQSSDHECGGFAVVGLHDEGDLQANGTKIRTYSDQPTKPNKSMTPRPDSITRGDAATGGWFPEYTMEDFQGFMWPKASPTGRRIVISYGSNPLTNGNGAARGGTPGNHTPQDILVSADDNVNGQYASRITGKGLLDNTDLEPIMEDFLGVKVTTSIAVDPTEGGKAGVVARTYPNPVLKNGEVRVEYTSTSVEQARVAIYNAMGQRVRDLGWTSIGVGNNAFVWDTKDDVGSTVPTDTYVMVITTKEGDVVERMIVL